MRTWNRICIKDFQISALNGDTLRLKRGKDYLTSDINDKDEVMVFSTFWVWVPVYIFAGEELFTGQ